jgi:hypothetical protein
MGAAGTAGAAGRRVAGPLAGGPGAARPVRRQPGDQAGSPRSDGTRSRTMPKRLR